MARIPSVEEIGRMSHEELVKAWVEQEDQAPAEIDKEAGFEPEGGAGDYQAEVDRISKLSPEELEKEWLKQEEEAANKSVKKEKVTDADIAWLRKAQQESMQSKRVRIQKICPKSFIEIR